MESAHSGYEQYVKDNTILNKILDKCFGNIKEAYTSRSRPPLSNSDHNTVYLIPTYKTLLKRHKPVIKSVNVWSEDTVETLKGCFLCTDWEVFHSDDINETTMVTTDYIKFCTDNVVPQKEVITYANNKPYITKEIKMCINKKKLAFRNQDRLAVSLAQKELNGLLSKARTKHKELLENKLNMSNPKQLWDSMKSLTNMQPSRKCVYTSDDLQKAKDLNNFYLRFEKSGHIPMNNTSDMESSGVYIEKLLIDANQINYYFKHICPRKSAGPDGISAYILKNFADELTPVWLPIFQQSLDTGIVPSLWKRAVIIPVPKIVKPISNNDFRPIALTSVIMKCFEKCIVSMLKAEIATNLDPLQFAYRQGRGTEDAISSIMHLILKHLENHKAYARLLFIDFSSAFNTIQPPLLITKMEQLSVNPSITKWCKRVLF